MRTVTALALMLAAAPALAAPPQTQLRSPPPLTARQAADYLPDGAKVEVRLDADVTGDGMKDAVIVGTVDDTRKLVVLAAYVSETDMGYEPIGSTLLEPAPLAAATLEVKSGVLLVQDLTGGTSAVDSLYRYRYVPTQRRMQLIGDDVSFYSRTYLHDQTEISTNRLTGLQIAKVNKLANGRAGDAALIPGRPQVRHVPRAPVWMEDAPTPSKTLGLED